MKRLSEGKKDFILLLVCAFLVFSCAAFDAYDHDRRHGDEEMRPSNDDAAALTSGANAGK